MRSFFIFLLALTLPSIGLGAVVRPAPNFTFPAARKSGTLRSLKGQAVVLLVADGPNNHAFRKELKYLRQVYQQYASRQVVFAAAFRKTEGPVKSDIPFVVANNGPAVAAAYGVDDDFQLIIIGKDGNIDYQTAKVCTGERVRDVIQNSFPVQAAARK
jgi:hypothetical protein